MHYKTMSQWLRRRWIMVRTPILCSLTLAVGVCIGAWPVSSAWLLPTCCCRSTATPRWITTSPRPHRPSRSTETAPLQRKSSVARIKDSRNDIVLLGSLADTTNTAEPQQATTSSNSGYYFGTERPQERIQDTTSSTTTTIDSSISTTNTAASSSTIPTTDWFPLRLGPDPATKPNYEEIVGPLGRTVDQWLLQLFRSKLAARVGWDSSRNATDYLAVPELALRLTQQFPHDPTQVQERSRQVLLDLFPSWLPPSYAVLFSRPFPQFAARMNAWATWVAGTWLMGKCEIHDLVVVVENDNDSTTLSNNNNAPSTTTTVLRGQGLLVERCRFLEEAGCASVCVHACQIPTQTFFQQHMGLSLRMEPNYDTFACQFSFGLPATDTTNALARATPCLARCPASQSLRQNHPASGNTKTTLTNVAGVAATTSTTTTTTEAIRSNAGNVEVREIPCAMMGDTE